ncbi:hypothetical protein [Nocardioides rubriscoriae]|nr:hypothetical protein [Nocardioides rubriscoriae]
MAPTTERPEVVIAMLTEMCALLLPDSDGCPGPVETDEVADR